MFEENTPVSTMDDILNLFEEFIVDEDVPHPDNEEGFVATVERFKRMFRHAHDILYAIDENQCELIHTYRGMVQRC